MSAIISSNFSVLNVSKQCLCTFSYQVIDKAFRTIILNKKLHPLSMTFVLVCHTWYYRSIKQLYLFYTLVVCNEYSLSYPNQNIFRFFQLSLQNVLLELCHMKGTTTGRDIYEYVNLALEKFNVDKRKIYSITTDGAPALTGKNNGFVALFKQSVDHEILNNHCLIHQQQLCAQKLNMKHLMTDIVKVVNFIRSRGLNHREFKAYLDEVGSEYEDVVYFSKVRWLSRATTLKRFKLLLPEIKQFMEKK